MLRNYDYSQELGSIAQDPEGKIDPGMIRRGVANGVGAALAELSAEDRAALMRFSTTPAFLKIRTLTPRMIAASAEWGNRRDPATEAKLAVVMGEAARRFLHDEGQAKR